LTPPVDVRAPVENVNDDTVSIVRWLVDNGSFVREGVPLLLAETTKTSFDIMAPADGYVWQIGQAGTDVPVGSVLCWIADTLENAKSAGSETAPPAATHPPKAPVADSSPAAVAAAVVDRVPVPGLASRFSRKAAEALQARGLDPKTFAGRGLVRERDVLEIGLENTDPGPPAANSVSAIDPPESARVVPPAGVLTRTERLSRQKRTEGRRLRAAHANTLLSAVTIAVPAHGFFSGPHEQTGYEGFPAAVLIYETARLLRAYPMFNAFYAADEIHYYEEVNIGYAVDIDKGLKVPVIRRADQKTLREVADEKLRLIVEYLNDSLPLDSLVGGTFTITDLSGEGVSHFQPCLNEAQAAILGVCAEVPSATGQGGAFNLVLAFDHQVADARSAAAFLRDLRDRLTNHDASLNSYRRADAPSEPHCSRCLRPAGELQELRHFLVRTAPDAAGVEQMVCTICLQDW
jgi:pyruvate/2-oxoglutarate dehydrogenase complex dihydrolipoamide acyltransferase (E2) component